MTSQRKSQHLLVEVEKLTARFILKLKWPAIAKTIFKRGIKVGMPILSEFHIYCKVKSMRYYCKERQIDQWTNRHTHIWSIYFQQHYHSIQWVKKKKCFFNKWCSSNPYFKKFKKKLNPTLHDTQKLEMYHRTEHKSNL